MKLKTPKKSLLTMFLIALFVVGFAAMAHAEAVTVVSAENAYAYNPNPPYEVVALKSGDVIPEGWNVYLPDGEAEVVLMTDSGEQVTISDAGYYGTDGSVDTPDADVQEVVTEKAEVMEEAQEFADSAEGDDADDVSDDADDAGLDAVASA